MFIVGNWKAYIDDLGKAKELFSLVKRLSGKTKNKIVIAPPASLLGALAPSNKSRVAFAAQDVSLATGGAHTGELVASSFASVGAKYAIIGHSERRRAGDTNQIVSEKVIHALACNLIPILCIGEEERDTEGKYLNYVREELTSTLMPLSPKDRAKIVIAYEPIWAIGKTAQAALRPNDLTEMVLYIRKVLTEIFAGKTANKVPILYGGSVEPLNIRDLAGASSVDGFLIGHASVDLKMFAALVKNLS